MRTSRVVLRPPTVALVDGDRRWTWDEVDAGVRAAAAEADRRGVRPGDRVVVSAPNSPEQILALLALVRLDTSVVLLDEHRTPAERRRVLARTGACWLVCDDALLAAHPGDPTVPTLRLRELTGTEDPGVAGTPGDQGTAWYHRQDALIVWSSGSTGEPKGIVRPGRSMMDNLERTSRRMGYRQSDVFLPLLPFSHQYGLSVLLLWWRLRASLICQPIHRVDRAIEAIMRHGVTVVDAAPATYHAVLGVLAARGVAPERLSSVRMWCVGGAPLGAALAERFTGTVGSPLLDGYGASETGNIALAPPGDDAGCGRSLDGVRVEVVDDDGRPVEAGRAGEIVVHTPDLMVAQILADGTHRPVPDGPFRTGDHGTLDAEGRLRVEGRRAAVHRLGHTLYPDSIAVRATCHDAEVMVVATPDERRGAALVFVVADPALRDVRFWRRAFAQRLGGDEQPNRIVVWPRMPLTPTGKVDRRAVEAAVALEADHVDDLPTVGSAGTTAVVGTRPGEEEPTRHADPAHVPFPERAAALARVARLLRESREQVIALLTEVTNHSTAVGELDAALETLEGAVAEVATYRPDRVASSAVFMPSNIPLHGYVLYLLVPSLFCERITFRPSRWIRPTTERLHELLAGEHRLPIVLDDSTQRGFVEGPAAEAELLVFTGSYRNGETIRDGLRPGQLMLFFGQGVNPVVVGADADLDLAVAGITEIRMLNSGQDCFGPDIVLVDESVRRRFTDVLVKTVDGLVHGAYDDPDADYGSMLYPEAFAFAVEHLHRRADDIVHGGRVDVATQHLVPTVLQRGLGRKNRVEEVFAPIFNVDGFDDLDTLHGVLTSPYFSERAMFATIYGDLPRTAEVLRERHDVCLNATPLDTDDGNAPFGGRGVYANYAAYRGSRTAEPLLVSKAVADHLPAAREAAAARRRRR